MKNDSLNALKMIARLTDADVFTCKPTSWREIPIVKLNLDDCAVVAKITNVVRTTSRFPNDVVVSKDFQVGLIIHDGETYLFNSEGYDYPRYIVAIR